jgi:U3 small nucleolar RNA-associated protein 11
MKFIGTRVHKERPQPVDRRKLGPLEKHKDYKVRAENYNKKKSYLHNLRRKAETKNVDEFYFKMNHLKMVKGKLIDTKPKKSKRQDKEVKKKQLLLFTNIRNIEKKV